MPRSENAPAFSSSQRRLAIGLVLGVTLVAFEATAVITALPTITDELHGDSLYGLTLASYTLADLAALVAAGALSDRKGPRLPFILSIGVFVLGLVVAGAAGSMPIVVLGRTLQGAGTGGLAPIAYVLVKRAFPDNRQGTMYAILSAGWVLPSLVAPFFAGFVTQHFGWRWVFLGIIPFAVAVGALASRPMRAYGPVDHAQPQAPSRIAWAVAAAGGIGAFVIGLRSANLFAAVAISVGGLTIALPSLRRLMPPGFLTARRGIPAVLVCRTLATATFLGIDSFVPLAADRIHGATPLVQGLVIIGAALAWTAGQAIIARRPHTEPRRAVALGYCLLIIGIILVTPVLWAGWPLWATFLSWPIGGLGMGILFNPTTVVSMSYADPGQEGKISGQIHLADSLGFSVMGGLGGAIVAIADRTSIDLASALGAVFGLAICFAVVGLVASRRVEGRGEGRGALA